MLARGVLIFAGNDQMAAGRDRITILDRKTELPSWMIVCDLVPGETDEDGPMYSHHWTGSLWEPRAGDEFHIYKSREVAESYLKNEVRPMLRMLPGRRFASFWTFVYRRLS